MDPIHDIRAILGDKLKHFITIRRHVPVLFAPFGFEIAVAECPDNTISVGNTRPGIIGSDFQDPHIEIVLVALVRFGIHQRVDTALGKHLISRHFHGRKTLGNDRDGHRLRRSRRRHHIRDGIGIKSPVRKIVAQVDGPEVTDPGPRESESGSVLGRRMTFPVGENHHEITRPGI